MHELGIMTGVADSVVTAARNANALSVEQVTLRVGEMTEAIEDALFFAFDVIKESEPLLAHAELKVVMVTPLSRCLECGAEYEHDRFHMLCPECNGSFTQLLRGRELQIDNIEVELPDEEEE
ncbi:MAG: hydrogenase maturation nickel metallochaperone HypA [Coriobacteriia bacterium]|nr:hydrogenase maturation nickel metallochaperone HypA [Coriobacteriia bacterium]